MLNTVFFDKVFNSFRNNCDKTCVFTYKHNNIKGSKASHAYSYTYTLREKERWHNAVYGRTHCRRALFSRHCNYMYIYIYIHSVCIIHCKILVFQRGKKTTATVRLLRSGVGLSPNNRQLLPTYRYLLCVRQILYRLIHFIKWQRIIINTLSSFWFVDRVLELQTK